MPVCVLPGCGVQVGRGCTCSGCHAAHYCCREHQRKDWPAHKKRCKDAAVQRGAGKLPASVTSAQDYQVAQVAAMLKVPQVSRSCQETAKPDDKVRRSLHCFEKCASANIWMVSEYCVDGMCFVVPHVAHTIRFLRCRADVGVFESHDLDTQLLRLGLEHLDIASMFPGLITFLRCRWAESSCEECIPQLFCDYAKIGCCVAKELLPNTLSSARDGCVAPQLLPVTAPVEDLLSDELTPHLLHLFADLVEATNEQDFYDCRALSPTNIKSMKKALTFQAKWMDIAGYANEAGQIMCLREEYLADGVNSAVHKHFAARFAHMQRDNLDAFLSIRAYLAEQTSVTEPPCENVISDFGFRAWAKILWNTLAYQISSDPRIAAFGTLCEPNASMFIDAFAWALEYRFFAPRAQLLTNFIKLAAKHLRTNMPANLPEWEYPLQTFFFNVSLLPMRSLLFQKLDWSKYDSADIMGDHHRILRGMSAKQMNGAISLWLSLSDPERKELCDDRVSHFYGTDEIFEFFHIQPGPGCDDSATTLKEELVHALADQGKAFVAMVQQARAKIPSVPPTTVRVACELVEALQLQQLDHSLKYKSFTSHAERHQRTLSDAFAQISRLRSAIPALRNARSRREIIQRSNVLPASERSALLALALKDTDGPSSFCRGFDDKMIPTWTALLCGTLQDILPRVLKPSFAPRTLTQADCTLWMLFYAARVIKLCRQGRCQDPGQAYAAAWAASLAAGLPT